MTSGVPGVIDHAIFRNRLLKAVIRNASVPSPIGVFKWAGRPPPSCFLVEAMMRKTVIGGQVFH